MLCLHVLLFIFLIISFSCEDQISSSDLIQEWAAFAIGLLLETLNFLYTCMLPMQVARDITEQKLKQMFSRQFLDPRTHSFVGTVVGAMLGATFIADSIMFANVNFLAFRLQESYNYQLIFWVVALMLAASALCLVKDYKKELMRIQCIAKLFPKKIRSYKLTHEET